MRAVLTLALLLLRWEPAGPGAASAGPARPALRTPGNGAQADGDTLGLLAAVRSSLIQNNEDYVSSFELTNPDPLLPSPAEASAIKPNWSSLRASLMKNWNHSLADRFVVIKNPDQLEDPRVPTLDVAFSHKQRSEEEELNENYTEDKQAFGYRDIRSNRSAYNGAVQYVTQQVYEVTAASPGAPSEEDPSSESELALPPVLAVLPTQIKKKLRAQAKSTY